MVGIATPMQQALLQRGVSGDGDTVSPGSNVASPLQANRVYNALNTPIAMGLRAIAPAPLSLFASGVSRISDMAVKDAAAGYGISGAQVDAGRREGAASQSANSSQLGGVNAGLGGLGTGGQGGIDSAGDGQSSGGCFITTATVGQFGWSDDCRVLNILRKFRDEVVLKMPNGKEDIATYYRIAPSIASNMTERDKAKSWSYIRKALCAIHRGKYLRAYRIYKGMVNDLSALQR